MKLYEVTNHLMEFHTLLRTVNLSYEFSVHYLSFTGNCISLLKTCKTLSVFLLNGSKQNIHIIQQHFNRPSVTIFHIDDTQ